MGSTGANPYVRAWVAENGLMALNKSEVIYLDAYSDDDANPLVSSCDYIIQGRAPDARWWDITVYDQDGFLIANDQDRYSFSSTDITFEPDGSFKQYWLRVPPGVQTCQEAVAWTFDLTHKQYQPMIET